MKNTPNFFFDNRGFPNWGGGWGGSAAAAWTKIASSLKPYCFCLPSLSLSLNITFHPEEEDSKVQCHSQTSSVHHHLLILAHVHLKHCRLLILRSHKAGVKTEQSLKRAIRATLTKLSSHKQLNLNCEERFFLLPPVWPL